VASIDVSGAVDDRGVVQADVRYSDPDKLFTVFMPAGTVALDKDKRPLRRIDVRVLDDHPILPDDVAMVGVPLEFDPSGATFNPPIRISLGFDPSLLPDGFGADDLDVAFFDTSGNQWVDLHGTVEAATTTVTGSVSHFTSFAILTRSDQGVNWLVLFGILAAELGLGLAGYLYVVKRGLPTRLRAWLAPLLLLPLLIVSVGHGLHPRSVHAQTGGTSVTLRPSAPTVAPGANFDIDVLINSDTATRGAQFGVTFDPHLVRFSSADAGEFYSDWADAHDGQATIAVPFRAAVNAAQTSVGAVAILAGDAGGPSGSGRLLRMSFAALPGASGPVYFGFDNLKISSAQARSLPVITATGAGVGVGLSTAPAAPTPFTVVAEAAAPATDDAAPPAPASAQSQASPLAVLTNVPGWVLVLVLSVAAGALTYALLYGGAALITWLKRAGRGALAIGLAVALTNALPVSRAEAAGTSVTISPQRKTVNPGEQFQVDVQINTDGKTRGLQMALGYDPSVVELTRVQAGSFYQSWATGHGAQVSIAVPFRPNATTGKTTVGALAILGGPGTDGPTGSGQALSLQFTAKSGIAGWSPIVFLQGSVSGLIEGRAQNVPGVMAAPGVVVVGPPNDSVAVPRPGPLADAATAPQQFVPTPVGVAPQQGQAPPPTPTLIPAPAVVTPPPIDRAAAAQAAPPAPPTAVPVPTQAPVPAAAQPPPSAPPPVPVAQQNQPAQAPPPPIADAPANGPPQSANAPAAAGAQASGATSQGGVAAPEQVVPLMAALATQQAGGPTVAVPTTAATRAPGAPLAAAATTPATASTPQAATPAPVAAAPQPAPARAVAVTAVARPVAATAAPRPRGGAGVFIPYELLAGIGGGIVTAGLLLYALRRHERSARP
jgi:hypothetical protein